MIRLHLDRALLPEGWAANVGLDLQDGAILAIHRDTSPAGRERIGGLVLPGLPNLHSHAFQRAMAGLAEIRGPADDSFWTWRQVMYRFLERLDPDDIEAIAAFAYAEMLERGFTAVVEFHYLHHDSDGAPYAQLAETSQRIAAAAGDSGIGLTLLPSFYRYGSFGEAPPHEGQRRFLNDPDRFLRLVEEAGRVVAVLPDACLGIAPHSLRAVTPETLREVVVARPDGPIHIHAAEQTKEVEDCVAWSGRRPVEWLLGEMAVDARWCLIHTTHMTEAEVRGLARSGATAGLCPITEASLGDGIFAGRAYLAAGGRFGVGTDSNVDIGAAAELRQLEYSQRLRDRGRNILSLREGQSTGRALYEGAVAGGAQAAGRRIGAIAEGCRADLVVLDGEHPDLCDLPPDRQIDRYVFAAGRDAIARVYVGGVLVVDGGRHVARDAIAARYRRVMRRLAAP